MSVQPTELKLVDPSRLRITWSDGQVREYSVRELREHARARPAARSARRRLRRRRRSPVLSPAETQPLRIAAMQPTGRYAYSIHFSDGHDTGIYTLELLRELGSATE